MSVEPAALELDGGRPVGIWPEPPRVLHCDNHLLALVKPYNMPVMADASGDPDLLSWGRAWVEAAFRKPGRAWLGLLHRLDRPAAGVVVLARTSKAAGRLSLQFRRRTVRKSYRAWVQGEPPAEGRLVHRLAKDTARNLSRVVAGETGEGQAARLAFRVLQVRPLGRGQAVSEVEILLETGRPHQIRAQFAAEGHPLLGDLKYGAARPLPAGHIALFARELEVAAPVGGGRQVFTAPLPDGWGRW